MEMIKRYLDGMFRELPRGRRARELKAEMLANIEERYRELKEKKIEPEKIRNQLIAEIGTSTEIRENINLENPVRPLVIIGIQALLIIAAICFYAYVQANMEHYKRTWNFLPSFAATLIAVPAIRFFSVLLVLNILNFLVRPRQISISLKWVRIACMVIGLIALGWWLLFSVQIVLSLAAGWVFPPVLRVNPIIYNHVNIIAGFAGLLIYLGIKR